jgi:inhibitor of cysteine peptidase
MELKMMIRKIAFIAALLAVLIPAAACSLTPPTSNIEIKTAPIHEVKVDILKSNPPQVAVNITLGLSDGCTKYHDAVVTRNGNTVTIKVTTERPKDAVCTAIYGYFEKTLNLGTDFTAGTTYTLQVNDYSTTFRL